MVEFLFVLPQYRSHAGSAEIAGLGGKALQRSLLASTLLIDYEYAPTAPSAGV